MNTADAITRTLESPNVSDSNFEPANVVDVINHLANATHRVSTAITPQDSAGYDDNGGRVTSLTEAVMGITNGLRCVSVAIDALALAVAKHD